MDKIEKERAISSASETAKHYVKCGFLENGPAWSSAWSEHHLKWSDGDSAYVTIPLSKVDALVSEARACPEVLRLAQFVAGTRLNRNVALPDALRILIGEFLIGDFAVPKGKAGRKRNWGRDFIIIHVMRQILLSYDIPATANLQRRGVRSTEVSASEIMVEALRDVPEIGHMELGRIQRIWSSPRSQADAAEAFGHHLTSILDDLDEPVRV